MVAKIAELEKRLEQFEGPKTPQNSSLPPSSQHPHAARPKRPKSKRNRGGQPGHRKHDRALIPTSDCDETKTLKPTACRRCGTRLSGSDPAPLRHQVWELPEIKPLVTEYQRHRLTCPCCSETTCAALPSGVPTGQSGPRLVAFSGLLMAYFRQSKRRTALFLEDLLGQPCCPALTVKMQNQVSQALAEPYLELNGALADQPQVFMDESSTKEGPARAWLWTAVAPTFAVFAICLSRAATAIGQLLGDGFTGTINCDRAKMYWHVGRLQWCWAHLQRDIQALIEHPDRQVKRLGHDLMKQATAMFKHWREYHAGTISRRTFRRRMERTPDGLGTREFIRVLLLLEKATLDELASAVDYALGQGIADADTIRVILEHRRESPIALFCLDSRPHLKLVHVPPTDISAYASLLETEVSV